LQQTPSTQLPSVQSVPTPHAAPMPNLSPQWPVCVLQVTGATQSAFDAHDVAHWMLGPVHLLYGAQDTVTTVGHVPAPLQVAASVSMAAVVAVPATHDRFRQPCALLRNWHRAVPAPLVAVLLPAHRPLRPQVVGSAAAMQADAGSGSDTPAATGEQVPTVPARRQDSQVPVQAVLQHTPGLPSVR